MFQKNNRQLPGLPNAAFVFQKVAFGVAIVRENRDTAVDGNASATVVKLRRTVVTVTHRPF
jgi:hypothetical protein